MGGKDGTKPPQTLHTLQRHIPQNHQHPSLFCPSSHSPSLLPTFLSFLGSGPTAKSHREVGRGIWKKGG